MLPYTTLYGEFLEPLTVGGVVFLPLLVEFQLPLLLFLRHLDKFVDMVVVSQFVMQNFLVGFCRLVLIAYILKRPSSSRTCCGANTPVAASR